MEISSDESERVMPTGITSSWAQRISEAFLKYAGLFVSVSARRSAIGRGGACRSGSQA